jgi:copper chaperone
MQFRIENMTCGGCVRSVTKTIHAADPSAEITADPVTRTLDVTTTLSRDVVAAALADVGYPAT